MDFDHIHIKLPLASSDILCDEINLTEMMTFVAMRNAFEVAFMQLLQPIFVFLITVTVLLCE